MIDAEELDNLREARSETVKLAKEVAHSLPPPAPGSLHPPILFAREGALINLAAARAETVTLVRRIAAKVAG